MFDKRQTGTNLKKKTFSTIKVICSMKTNFINLFINFWIKRNFCLWDKNNKNLNFFLSFSWFGFSESKRTLPSAYDCQICDRSFCFISLCLTVFRWGMRLIYWKKSYSLRVSNQSLKSRSKPFLKQFLFLKSFFLSFFLLLFFDWQKQPGLSKLMTFSLLTPRKLKRRN